MRRLIKKTINLLVSFLIYKKNHKGFFRCIAFFLAVHVFLFSFVYCFCVPVYAAGGIVEAETIWQGWQTLGLILGVSTDFDNNISISANNQRQYEFYYNKIMSDTSLSENEKNQLIGELDTMRAGFLEKIIDVGQSLWYNLMSWVYNDKIKTEINLYPFLTSSQKSVFDSWSGTCVIARPLNYNFTTIIFNGSSLYAFPDNYRTDGDGTKYYYSNSSGAIYLMDNSQDYATYFSRQYAFSVKPSQTLQWQYIQNKDVNQEILDSDNSDSLVGSLSWQEYIDGITGNFSIVDGSLVDTNTGEAPIVLDGDTLDDTIAGIQDGTLTYQQAIDDVFDNTNTGDIVGEVSPVGKKALDEMITGLNVSQVQYKFPFCIPHDIYLIASGAAAVSSNAPVIKIPLHIEFRNTVYYDNNEAVVIDFKMFDPIIDIVRTGFFLLFLIGLIWGTIGIMQSFFQITE